MTGVVEVGFDYATLDIAARDEVRDATVRIKVRMTRTVEDIIEIGSDLIAVKEMLGHGNFLRWIETEFAMTERTAQSFMRVCSRFGSNTKRVADLSFRAIAELAAPSTPDEVVDDVTERAAKGETFTAADIKEMKAKFKAEKAKLKADLKAQKLKAKDAAVLRDAFSDEVKELEEKLSKLMNQNIDLENDLKRAAAPPAAAPPEISEAVQRQADAIAGAWSAAGTEARRLFLIGVMGDEIE